MKRLAVLGASGHGRVVADVALSCGWNEIVFFDDSWPKKKQNINWPVVGTLDDFYLNNEVFKEVFIAIGNNEIRRKMMKEIKCLNFAIIDLAEYLDTHPNDRKAICLHREYTNELNELKDKYQRIF